MQAAINFNVDQFELTELQEERLKVLMGPFRYNEEEGKGRIVCESFPDYESNLQKAIEQFKEVMY